MLPSTAFRFRETGLARPRRPVKVKRATLARREATISLTTVRFLHGFSRKTSYRQIYIQPLKVPFERADFIRASFSRFLFVFISPFYLYMYIFLIINCHQAAWFQSLSLELWALNINVLSDFNYMSVNIFYGNKNMSYAHSI